MSNFERIVTGREFAEQLALKMGANAPSALEVLKNKHFASDDELLDAATKLELERDNQEYRKVRARLESELARGRQKEQMEKQQQFSEDAYRNAVVDANTVKNIDEEAAVMAKRDLAEGRIRASELGSAIEEHAKELTENERRRLAKNATMNALLRGEI